MTYKIFNHNWIAIIYFNFRMLPLKQAIKLPFDFYYKIRFENLTGKVHLNSNYVKRAMIKFGGRGSEMFGRNTTIIDLKGDIYINGILEFGHGTLLRIEKNAIVSFGDNVRIGALTKVYCEERIDFGNELDFSWECQIFDTNFHDMYDSVLKTNIKRTEPIFVGSYNWIGNRVTFMKGTRTPDYFTVASNSLCNKDYSNLDINTIVGGYPAKIIKSNCRRIFEINILNE